MPDKTRLETSIKRFIGPSTDTKPTGVPVGSTYLEWDTPAIYVTYDGTHWVRKDHIDTSVLELLNLKLDEILAVLKAIKLGHELHDWEEVVDLK